MRPDEAFLGDVLAALRAAGLEAIVVGTVAASLCGAPVLTEDIGLLVRDTRGNRAKIDRLCAVLGARAVQVSPLTRTLRLIGPALPVDLLFDEISGGLRFESIRARSRRVAVGDRVAVVADLADVVASKEAAGRPKDLAQLPLLRDALRVRAALARRKKR